MTTTAATLADLRTVDLFDDLGDEGLQEFADVARLSEYGPGDVVAEQGAEAPGLILVLEGQVQAFVVDGTVAEPAGLNVAPTWMGAIAAP